MSQLRAVICGFGSIGRRHAANLRQLVPDAEITVWRQHARETDVSDLPDDRVNVVYSLEDALAANPQIALICNPAPFHVATAQHFADAGAHIFMEKPLSDSLVGVGRLLETCAGGGPVLFMAYPLRFDHALIAMRDAIAAGSIGELVSISATVSQYLPDWRPEIDYRNSVSARKELGGGVLLELSHELDYVQWIMGRVSSVSARVAKLSELEIDVEDTADLEVEFESGATGTVHLDMVERNRSRSCVVTGTEGVVEWDGLSRVSRMKPSGSKEWQQLSSRASDRNDVYLDELEHFLGCATGDEKVAVTGDEGRSVLALILAARNSADLGESVTL